ncbi:unnamed protein product [Pieris macdunnoughi]|uniref:Uncharacterized protein n=1 Tax=Pieris macdunnoughi TaxID=345717 RepID=A0A821TV62_9NEOP|nr:unnamed protein product [Pieris macdunnoughi]
MISRKILKITDNEDGKAKRGATREKENKQDKMEYFGCTEIRSIAVAVRAFQLAHNDWRRQGARCDAAGGRTSDFTADIATARCLEPDPYYV